MVRGEKTMPLVPGDSNSSSVTDVDWAEQIETPDGSSQRCFEISHCAVSNV